MSDIKKPTLGMKHFKTSICSLFFLCFALHLFSQSSVKIDSLTTTLKFAETDTHRISILWDLSEEYITTDFNKAIEHLRKAVEIAEQLEDEYRIAKTKMLIGNVYTHSGDYDEGTMHILMALEYFEREQIKKEMYISYIIIGVIHDRIYKYDEALEYYFNALNIANELKKADPEADKSLNTQTLYNNIGNIYSTNEENETAIDYYLKGVESAIQRDDYGNLGVLYNNLGKMYNKLEQPDTAYKYLIKSLSTREKIKDKAGMAKSYYFLAAHFFDLPDYEQALDYATKSLNLGKEVGSLQTQHTAMWFIYQIYYEMGMYKESVDSHIEYKVLSDSMYNNQTINEITRLKMQFEFDAQEAERALVLQKTKFKYAFIIVGLLLIIVVVGLFAVLIRFKARKVRLEKDNLEKDIELKNKELATNVMYMVRKNEMINSVAKKLLDLKERVVEQNKKPIQDIALELQTEADKNIWKEFEMRFQKVHNEFYQHLLEKHPDLSPNEGRLVALLRLNMTTKEIAAITHQNIKSVEVARARLRKKLNLTGTDVNLVGYLNSL